MSASVWLGIETSSRPGSVAAVTGGEELQLDLPGSLSTSESLLPALQELLDRIGTDGRNLAGIGVCLGPGSYTGLRIGAATAMGLSSGWGIPVRGVPALRAIASASGAGRPVIAVIRARDGEVFASAYASSSISSPEILPAGVYECPAALEWLSANPGVVCAGPGACMLLPCTEQSLSEGPRASVIARLAREMHIEGGPDRHVRPLYLRSFRQRASSIVP